MVNFRGSLHPDGSRVVYSSRNPNAPEGHAPMVKHNSSDLFILTLKDGSIERLTENNDMEVLPDWSLDGNYITYTLCAAGNREIYLLNLKDKKSRRLSYSGGKE